METRANYVLVGLFTLAAIAGAFVFVYWFQQFGGAAERDVYRVVFDRSVSGLRTGAAVLFNGLRVGEVADLRLNPENPSQVLATIAVDQATPMRADTKVGLDFQGLTGVASVSLSGGSLSQPKLASPKGAPATLVADASSSQDITQSAREVLGRIDNLLVTTSDSLRKSVKNIETVTGTLSRNSERFDRIMAGFENLSGGPDGKGDIQEAARAVRTLAENLDKRTAEISVGLAKFSNSGLKEFELLAVDGRRAIKEFEKAVKNFDRNPSRLLFGGPSPSQTDRRAR